MSFKILEYMVLIWKDYINKLTEEAPKVNRHVEPSELKRFSLPPILPIVFYEGKGNWTAEVQFKEKVLFNDIFEKYTPKFEYSVVNLNNCTKENLLKIPDVNTIISKPAMPNDISIILKEEVYYCNCCGYTFKVSDVTNEISCPDCGCIYDEQNSYIEKYFL